MIPLHVFLKSPDVITRSINERDVIRLVQLSDDRWHHVTSRNMLRLVFVAVFMYIILIINIISRHLFI